MESPTTRWRGMAALGLVIVLGLGVLGLLVIGLTEARNGGELSQDTTTLLSVVLGGIVGSVGTYMGMQAKASASSEPDTPDTALDGCGWRVTKSVGNPRPDGIFIPSPPRDAGQEPD